MIRRVLSFSFLVLSWLAAISTSVVVAAPLLVDPNFTQVSTQQGLPQDTVNALMVDRAGFLWIGTDSGLARYDGYKVLEVVGADRQLQGLAIYDLFQDKDGFLWVSTGSAGVFRLNLQTLETKSAGAWPFRFQPDYQQFSSVVSQDHNGDIWIANNEQLIKLNPNTFETSIIFSLSDEQIQQEHVIRYHWVENDVVYVGGTDGLYGVDIQSLQVRTIDYLQKVEANINNINVKYLTSDDTGQLWIGTVDGLFSMPIASLNGFVQSQSELPTSTLQVAGLNIWKMFRKETGQYYLATNLGLYSFYFNDNQLQHLLRFTDSRAYLTDNDIVSIAADKSGNLWLGSQFDGAMYWSPKSTRFTNVMKTSDGELEFSDNNIWSIHQQDKYSLWVGTNNGLNHYDLDTGDITPYLVSDDKLATYSEATMSQVLPSKESELWLVTGVGVRKFDTQSRQIIPISIDETSDSSLLEGFVYGATVDKNGTFWFIREDGFYSYSEQTKKIVKVENLNAKLNPTEAEGLFTDDKFPNSLFVSTLGQLWSYNLETQSLELIHELPKLGLQHAVAPDSIVLDDHGTLWIAYPGFGLFGLDSDNYQQKHFFDQSNLLVSNSIYDMQLGNDNHIWMSSHQGLLKFNPVTQHMQRYSYKEGLATLEFNQYAHAKLDDGRMVYGSLKGITLFDPKTLIDKSNDEFNVIITSIELSSTPLTMPLEDLTGQYFELGYEDVGLSIGFSTLLFEHQKNTRYSYRLAGSADLNYPVSREPLVTFPKLGPGTYQFHVTAFDPVSGNQSQPASISFKVHYAPWASPQAYTFYVVFGLSLLILLWYRRDQQNRRIKTAHREALKSKNRLSMALTASNSYVWEWRAANNTFYAPRIADELGYTDMGSEVTHEQHRHLIHPSDVKKYEADWQNFIRSQELGLDVTYRMKAKNGEWYWYRDVGSVISESNRKNTLVVAGTYSNITESLANREKVRLFGEAFKHTRDWVVIFNSQREPVAANQAFCEAFAIDEQDDLYGQMAKVFNLGSQRMPRFWSKLNDLKRTQHWKGEEQFILNNGKVCNVLINMTSVDSMEDQGESDYFLMIMSDISEQKEAEQELRRLANFDSLTNLPNRTLLLDRIKHAIDHANRNESTIGLFFIDLDRFKQVNDSLGHKAGDELLIVVANRLTNQLRQDDTVARLGGDEFVVMVEDVSDPEKLSVLARELIIKLEESIKLGNQSVSVSSSIGIALYPGDANSSEELLRNADLAMYHAKEEGRNNFQYFTEHMNSKAQARLALENQLKIAHTDKQFVNYYQPIINTQSKCVEGFELLMRWPNGDTMVPPDVFIPVAEELGLIENMTWDALDRAMPVLQSWQQPGNDVYLSVNLSARHFERQIAIEHIIGLLEKYNLPVSVLRFEITESALMKDYERALEYMQTMQEHGFVIALDDFGTGYSSLKYLKEFPIQVLKVDRSFVDDIGKNSSNEAIILTTLRMAESLNMYCIAEGIESQHQVDFFKLHQCEHLQGYFFSRPVPTEETVALVGKRWDDEL